MNDVPPEKQFKPDLIEKTDSGDVVKDFKISPFEKYQSKITTSAKALGFGLLLTLIGLVLLGFTEGLISEITVINRIGLTQIEDLTKTSGIVKIQGMPQVACPEYDEICDEDMLYTRTVQYINENKIYEKEKISNFKLGDVQVIPPNANLVFDLQEKSRRYDPETGFKEFVYGIDVNKPVIVLGNLANNTIMDTDVFIISNQSNDQMIETLINRQSSLWFITRVTSWLLLIIGFVTIALPVISFLDIFTGLGWLLPMIVLISSIALSTVIVFLTAIALRFWWLIFVIMGLLIILLIRLRFVKAKSIIK